MRSFGKIVSLALAAAFLAGGALAQEGLVGQPQFGQPPAAAAQPPAPPQGAPIVPGPAAIVPPALPQAALTPPPLPVAPAVVFFVEQAGQPVGPLSLQELQQRVQQGTIKGETLVWKQGSPAWVAAKDVAELAAVLAAIPPPVPQSEQYKRLLIGTWQAQTQDQFGVVTNSTLSYAPDGSYSGIVTQTFQSFSLPQVANGTWTVNPVSDGKFSLTMTPAGPTGGALPVTVVLRIIDSNNLFNDAERYQARRIR